VIALSRALPTAADHALQQGAERSGSRGDRRFESRSLHRRVDCELALEGFSSVDPALAGPDLLQHGYATANTASPSSYGGGRRITAGIQFAARRDNLSSTVSPSKS